MLRVALQVHLDFQEPGPQDGSSHCTGDVWPCSEAEQYLDYSAHGEMEPRDGSLE